MEVVFEEVKNGGKWGADDERGALNYISSEIPARAVSLRSGCPRYRFSHKSNRNFLSLKKLFA